MSADAVNDWLIIYRGYTPDQIAAERATLQRWLSTPYDAQTQGSKSYQKNLEGIRSRLAALQRAVNEKSGVPSVGIMDASAGIWGGQCASNIGANGYPNSTSW
jgi:hypothetical protein